MSESLNSSSHSESLLAGVNPPDLFLRAVEHALEHVRSHEWLGTHCPLALPYILNTHLSGASMLDMPDERGAVLAELLRQATLTLPQIQRRLLDVAYFSRAEALNSYE